MPGSQLEPVRRSRRTPSSRRLTTFEVVSLTLAVFLFCASTLRQFTSNVAHGPPGEIERGSLLGPLVLAGLIAAPAVVSLGLRRGLRRR